MLDQLKLQSLNINNFSKKEVDWLKLFIEHRFKEEVTEEDIIFTNEKDEQYVYFRAPKIEEFSISQNPIPEKFLKKRYIVKDIQDEQSENEYYTNIELVFFFFDSVNDILNYKKQLNMVFHFVMYGEDSVYDLQGKGYKVQEKHFSKVWNDWSDIAKTLFVGFAIFLKLFRLLEVKSLQKFFDGISNETLEFYGLSDVNREPFGRVSHYEKLNLCWNCGDVIDTETGLCGDCLDYWDRKTK